MTLGKLGTGPYGRIRTLYQQIKSYKYEISLIDQGVKKGKKTSYQKKIEDTREEIRQIRKSIKDNNYC